MSKFQMILKFPIHNTWFIEENLPFTQHPVNLSAHNVHTCVRSNRQPLPIIIRFSYIIIMTMQPNICLLGHNNIGYPYKDFLLQALYLISWFTIHDMHGEFSLAKVHT